MTPAEQEVLREIGAYLGALGEDLAQCAESNSETAVLAETIAGTLGRVEDAIEALSKKFVELHDEQRETNARLNSYLDEATRNEAGLRKLVSEVRRVDDRLKAGGL